MKYKILLGFMLIASLVLVTGCNLFSVDVGDLILNVKTEAECLQYSDNGYIWIANLCCLDSNQNDRCDKDERGSQTLCDSECSQPICGGDNKKVFYDCVMKEDGCKDYEAKGMVINECGIQCFSNSDCVSDERCFNNKCEKDKCGDGSCGLYEDCGSCPKDCLEQNQFCCNKKPIEGNCCIDGDCVGENQCINNQCTPYCGDGICNGEENCNTCNSDCVLEENQVCCENGIIKEDSCEETPINETNGNGTT